MSDERTDARDAGPVDGLEDVWIETFAAGHDVAGVAVRGSADLRAAPDLGAAIDAAIGAGIDLILVDLSDATFVDSSVLGVLLGARRRVGARGGAVAVACDEPNIRRVFELTMLDRVLALEADRDAAAATLRSSAAGGDDGLGSAALPADAPVPSPPVADGDVITLELPVGVGFDPVRRLVLGGIASRFELPVDRLEELQLAVDALAAHATSADTARLEVTTTDDGLRLLVGGFEHDPLADDGTARVVRPLVDEARVEENGDHWVELVVSVPRRRGDEAA